MSTSLTCYGGVAEIGGNKILLETGERTWLLDFGTRFSIMGRYFDEFLSPRSAVGLRDFLQHGARPAHRGALPAGPLRA